MVALPTQNPEPKTSSLVPNAPRRAVALAVHERHRPEFLDDLAAHFRSRMRGDGGQQRLAEACAEGGKRGAEAGDARIQEPAVRLLLKTDDGEVAAGDQTSFLHAAVKPDRH